MTTEIREPFGPGLTEQPGIRPPEPIAPEPIPVEAPQPIRPSAPTGVGSPEWWQSNRLSFDQITASLDPNGIGSIGGKPPAEWSALRSDPRNLTTTSDNWMEPVEVPGPVTLPRRGDGIRLGQMQLDFLNPSSSFDQVGNFIPGAENLGTDLFNVYNVRDIDWLGWDIPTRMYDYGIAVPLGLLAGITGEGSIPDQLLNAVQGQDDETFFPFHNQPQYYQWVVQATPEQMKQQAYAMSKQAWGGHRSQMAMDVILHQFEQDRQRLSGLSAGNVRLDYMALWENANQWEGVEVALPDATDGEREVYVQQMVDRVLAVSQREQIPISQTREEIERFVRTGNIDNIFAPLDQVGHALGFLSATTLPMVGTEVGKFVTPEDRFMRVFWMATEQDRRQHMFARVGGLSAVVDMAELVGAAILVPHAIGAAATAAPSWAPVLQGLGSAYRVSLTASKVSMAYSFAAMHAHLAATIVNPQYAETLGRRIDMARPISDSYFAAPLNGLGIFATGTWGVYTGAQFARAGAGQVARGARALHVPVPSLGAWEPQIVRLVYGSAGGRVGKLYRQLGIDKVVDENAIAARIMSGLIHEDMRAVVNTLGDAMNGVATGTPIDLYVAAAKLRFIEQQLRAYDPQAQAEILWKQWELGRFEPSLWQKVGDDRLMQAIKQRQKIHRATDNSLAQAAADDYQGRWGATPDAIRENLKAHLLRIKRNYPEAIGDLTGIDKQLRLLGDDLDDLQKATNRAHQIEFYLENGQMTEAARGSSEARRVHLVRADELFQDEITEAVITTLKGNDEAAAALAESLRTSKPDVARAMAKHPMTPYKLAEWLEDIRPSRPLRRELATDPVTMGEPLNAYHQRLVDDGVWTLGWIPYVDEALPLKIERFMPVLPDGTINFTATPRLGPVQALTEPPVGFRRVQRGEAFDTDRRFILTVGDGVYVNDIPGETIRSSAAPPPTTPGTTIKINDNLPPVADVSQDLAAQQPVWNMDGYFDFEGNVIEVPFPDEVMDFTEASTQPGVWPAGVPDHVSGNSGVQWPVLVDGKGNTWLFKHDKQGGNLSMGLIQTEARVGRLYALLGLDGAVTIPFKYRGTRGTLQPFYQDASEVGLAQIGANWSTYTRDQQEQILGHYVVDWLFSQHDTGARSLYFRADGHIVGVDKGQMFRYFDQGDWPPRLEYRPNAQYQSNIPDFLYAARQQDVVFDRGLVEEIVQKVESIPDEIFREEMLQIGIAREAAGYLPTSYTPETFADEMVFRKNSFRHEINRLFDEELGSTGIPHPEATVKEFNTGKPLEYQPTFGHTQFRNGNVSLDVLQSEADASIFPEPPADPSITRAGVVIVEDSGEIWVARPTNEFGGYSAQTIKGRVEPGESLRAAAVREALEETGFGVGLESHLIDWFPPDGSAPIRYYVAHRVSGSPSMVAKPLDGGITPEVDKLWLTEPQQAYYLVHDRYDAATDMFMTNERDLAVIDAFMQKKASGTLQTQVDDLPAGAIQSTATEVAPAPALADPTVPGASAAATERRYVSYQRLRTGEYLRVPWVDQIMSAPGPISLGNRSYLGAKLDSVFRGWRTWRIAQAQRAMLYRRMSTQYKGITSAQMEVFIDGLDDLAEAYHVPVQLIGNLQARALRTAPLIGPRVSGDVLDLARKVFGDNLVDARTGAVIPISKVPWRDIIAKSFRQSYKHNLTAGFTSWVYSLPGGWLPALVGQGIWPTLKFTLSPLFKAGEYAESGMFNLMRGVTRLPDDIVRLYEPHMGFSRNMIAGELGLSPYISGMGALREEVVGPLARSHATGEAAQFVLPGQSSGLRGLRTWEDILRRAPEPPPVTPAEVKTYLDADPLVVPADVYPRRVPDYTPEALLPRTVDENGNVMVDPSVPGWDAARLAEYESTPPTWDRMLETLDDVEQAMFGLTVLQRIGYENIDRLISSAPVVHNPGPDFLRQLDFSKPEYQRGPRGTRLEAGLNRAEAESDLGVFLRWFGPEGSMSREEFMLLTGGQAKYCLVGRRSSLGAGNVTFFLRQDRVMRRALITSRDRIDLGFRYPESGMTPFGFFRNERYQNLSNISEMKPGDELKDVLKPGNSGAEVAIMEGFTWEDVDTLVFETTQAEQEFLQKVANAPPEVRAKLTHIETRVENIGAYDTSVFNKFIEDWTWEKAGLNELKHSTVVSRPDPSVLSLLDPQHVPFAAGGRLYASVTDRLNAAGYETRPAITSYGRPGFMDEAAEQIHMLDESIDAKQSFAAQESVQRGGTSQQHHELLEYREKREQWLAFRDDLDNLRGSVRFHSLQETQEAINDTLPLLTAEEHTLWSQTTLAYTRGEISLAELRATIADENAFPSLSAVRRDDFAQAVHDGQVYGEAIARLQALKYNNMPLPRAGMVETWNLSSAPLRVRNEATGLSRELWPDPIPLGPGDIRSRANWTHAQALLRGMDDVMPPPLQRMDSVFENETKRALVPMEFTDALQRHMTARLGYDPGTPVINVYVRGSRKGVVEGPIAGDAEIVIVVRSANGVDHRLSFAEIEQLWKETALPTKISKYHPTTGNVAWDEVNQQVVFGDFDGARQVRPDGTEYIDATGIPGARVVFADSFEDGGMAWSNLSAHGGGIFDPKDINVRPGGGSDIVHEYASEGGSWELVVNPPNNVMSAFSPFQRGYFGRMSSEQLADRRLRRVWEVARDPQYGGKSWRVEVAPGRDADRAALMRAWYLGEIPDNVVLVDAANGAVLDDDWFRQAWGTRRILETPPRGLDDIPNSAEYLNAQFQKQLAEALGLDEADLLLGDLDAIAAKLETASGVDDEAKRGLVEFLKAWMDPIPYKEGAMSRLAMHEGNKIFVAALETSNDPALGLFRELGVPDDQILTFLMEDRRLLNRWLRNGRASDLDDLIAHSEKYLVGRQRSKRLLELLDAERVQPGTMHTVANEPTRMSDAGRGYLRAIREVGDVSAQMRVNEAIRTGDLESLRGWMPDELLTDVATLQAAANETLQASGQALRTPAVLYRGGGGTRTAGKKPGDVVDIGGIPMVTTTAEDALRYADQAKTKTVTRYHLPADTPLVRDQGGYLIPGGEYHVIGRETIDGITYVDVAPGPAPMPSRDVLRMQLDDLYSSDEYNTITAMWRMSLKAAQDEAFSVHFFNPYRSWLERSLNHPVFGVYPLSWALKAAREWARFLFDNRLLAGGKIRLGMAPAVAMTEMNRRLGEAAAMGGYGDLGDLLNFRGPLGNTLLIFGLIMPGDWSSIPFPLSRTMRELIRGNLDFSDHFEANMTSGVLRDARLFMDSGKELVDLLAKFVPDDPGAPQRATWQQPPAAPFTGYDYRVDAAVK